MIDPKIVTLLKVFETGSFSRAAEKLSLTQPAVSQHIRQIERELGVQIFNRSEGGMKVTDEGMIVIKYAKRMLALDQRLVRTLNDRKVNLTRLAVGITHTSESNLITEVLAKYCSSHAGMRMAVTTDTLNNLYTRLHTYEVDFVIIEGKITEGGYSSILLDTDCLMLAVSPDSPLAKKSVVTLPELRQEKMILRRPESGTRNLFVSHLESSNISIDEFNVIMEIDNVAAIRDLVRRNYGVSILARSACMEEVRKGRLVILPVENLPMVREVNMVYRNDFAHIDILQEIAHLYYEETGNYSLQ